GCNGVIDVLIEPVCPGRTHDPIQIFEQILATNEPVALATVFSNSHFQSEKLMIDAERRALISFSREEINQRVLPDLESVFSTRRSEVKQYVFENETLEVFVELIQPVISLMIFGGG